MRKTYLPLSDEDRDYLKALSKKRTIQAQVVDRARILLYKADGMTFQQIADKLARGLRPLEPRHVNGVSIPAKCPPDIPTEHLLID